MITYYFENTSKEDTLIYKHQNKYKTDSSYTENKNMPWFRVDFAEKRKTRFYRMINAKLSGSEYEEEPLSFHFIFTTKKGDMGRK